MGWGRLASSFAQFGKVPVPGGALTMSRAWSEKVSLSLSCLVCHLRWSYNYDYGRAGVGSSQCASVAMIIEVQL